MQLLKSLSQVFGGLRDGVWLTRQRGLEYALILLALEIAGFLFFVAGTHGLIVPLDHANASDFVSFYAAGILTNAGTPELAYHAATHYAAEQATTAPGIDYNYFYYPPVFLLLCATLARFPYLVAFILFEGATLLAYVVVAQNILQKRGWKTLVPLLAFPAVFWNMGLGQNAFLTAALYGAGLLLVDRRPILAGLLFGALSYKPHFGLLIPIALAAGRHWRAFAAAALSVAILVMVSIAAFGWETWHSYILAAASSGSLYKSDRVYLLGYASPFGAVLTLGGGPMLAYGVQAAATLSGLAWTAYVWTRGLSLEIRAATLIAATIVSLPVILFYDLMLGAVGMMWLLRAGGSTGFAAWQKTMLAILFGLPLASGNLGPAAIPLISPLFAVILVGVTMMAVRNEIARSGAIGKMVAANA